MNLQSKFAVFFIAFLIADSAASAESPSLPKVELPKVKLPSAPGRCPAGASGCTIENAAEKMKERVDEGRHKVSETSNPVTKAKEVGKTLRDCVQCGMDAVTGGANTVK